MTRHCGLFTNWNVKRWHPVAPLGVPHKSTKDDVYQNMFIPKGYGQEVLLIDPTLHNPLLPANTVNHNRSLVIANAYAITHDPAIYTELPLVEDDEKDYIVVMHLYGATVGPTL